MGRSSLHERAHPARNASLGTRRQNDDLRLPCEMAADALLLFANDPAVSRLAIDPRERSHCESQPPCLPGGKSNEPALRIGSEQAARREPCFDQQTVNPDGHRCSIARIVEAGAARAALDPTPFSASHASIDLLVIADARVVDVIRARHPSVLSRGERLRAVEGGGRGGC